MAQRVGEGHRTKKTLFNKIIKKNDAKVKNTFEMSFFHKSKFHKQKLSKSMKNFILFTRGKMIEKHKQCMCEAAAAKL